MVLFVNRLDEVLPEHQTGSTVWFSVCHGVFDSLLSYSFQIGPFGAALHRSESLFFVIIYCC
jgi:hypothetical protein